jgi:hypothetical protein
MSFHWDDQVKEDKMGGVRGTSAGKEKFIEVLFGKPEGKIVLGRF